MDPDVKTLDSGKKVAKFSVATTEKFKNGDGKRVSETTWHHLVLWGKLAETSEKYLKKGNQVAVEGRITHRDYEDKNGVKRYATEIIVSDLVLLNSPKEQE